MQNLIRFYEFTFFDIKNTGDNFEIIPLNNVRIFSSFNMTIDYTIMNGNFNTATFRLYNLGEGTQNLFTNTKNRRGFYFRACYEDEKFIKNNLIFQGVVYRVNSYREGLETITEIIAVDPYFNLQSPSPKNFKFPAGTPTLDIVRKVSNYLGVFNAFSGAQFLNKKTVYNHPLSFSNVPITTIIDMICRDNGCSWAYDKTGLRFGPLPNKEGITDFKVPPTEINAKTGLVMNVKAENLSVQLFPVDYFSERRLKNNLPYVTATALMRPLSLFDPVNLTVESKELCGLYSIVSLTYQGEFRGSSWYVTMGLRPERKT